MEKYSLEALAGLWIRNAGSCNRVEIQVNMRKDWILELFGTCSQWSFSIGLNVRGEGREATSITGFPACITGWLEVTEVGST